MQLIDINVFTYSLIQSLNRGEIAIEDGTKRAAAFINYLLKIGDVKGAMLVARVWLPHVNNNSSAVRYLVGLVDSAIDDADERRDWFLDMSSIISGIDCHCVAQF